MNNLKFYKLKVEKITFEDLHSIIDGYFLKIRRSLEFNLYLNLGNFE